MRFTLLTLALCFVPILAAATVSAAEPKGLDVRDLVAFDRISDPVVSPDGTKVAFTVSSLDSEEMKRRTDLWVVGIEGEGARRLTQHPASDTSAAWSPDGKWIWFLSSRSGSSQVWKIPVDGGEARPGPTLPLDVAAFRLSPDGAKLAVALEVFPDLATADETKKRLDEKAKEKATGRIYERLLYRHWDTWKDGRRSHLFVVPADGGEAVDVMKGMDADSPSKPFGGAEEFTFTPDGKAVVLTARDAGREEAWSTNLDLWVVPADGSAPPKRLTGDNPATDTQPVFSPTGRPSLGSRWRRRGTNPTGTGSSPCGGRTARRES
jgi:Dipeptidyl aminopeptidases/acylaminoacyl-peptidases